MKGSHPKGTANEPVILQEKIGNEWTDVYKGTGSEVFQKKFGGKKNYNTLEHAINRNSKYRVLEAETRKVRYPKRAGHDMKQEQVDDERQIRNAGAGFGSAEKNREVEKAAISFVTKQYKSQGWKVQSVEYEKKGYDLLCKKEQAEEHVEVKGVRGTKLSFIVTSGEIRQARENPRSVFCVVTSALDKPQLSHYTGQEFIESFRLEELAFRASLRREGNRKRR